MDRRRERRLIVGGSILSAYPLDGDWRAIRREYWWRAVADARLPRRPRALLVGLGGGTQAHVLAQRAQPRLVTVVERDPAMLRVALRWFALERVGPMEFLCADALEGACALARLGRRFDYVMEDAAYADIAERSRAVAQALVPLVAPGGTLVVNRHWRGDAFTLADALRASFRRVRLRRVRREGENVLLFCEEPTRRAAESAATVRLQRNRDSA